MLFTLVDCMKIEIIEEKKNPFFKRRELKLRIKHEKAPTPKKQDLIKELAAMFSTQEDKISVDYIFGEKGKAESLAKVKIKEDGKNEAQVS